jgi:hypothetical protein
MIRKILQHPNHQKACTRLESTMVKITEMSHLRSVSSSPYFKQDIEHV